MEQSYPSAMRSLRSKLRPHDKRVRPYYTVRNVSTGKTVCHNAYSLSGLERFCVEHGVSVEDAKHIRIAATADEHFTRGKERSDCMCAGADGQQYQIYINRK